MEATVLRRYLVSVVQGSISVYQKKSKINKNKFMYNSLRFHHVLTYSSIVRITAINVSNLKVKVNLQYSFVLIKQSIYYSKMSVIFFILFCKLVYTE